MPLVHSGKVLIRLIKRSDKIKEIAAVPYWIKKYGWSPWEKYEEYEEE
jgi:hypothetical protein